MLLIFLAILAMARLPNLLSQGHPAIEKFSIQNPRVKWRFCGVTEASYPSNVTRQNSTSKKTPKRHNKAAIMGGDTATSTKKKRGLFSRFRKKNKGKSVKEEKPLEATPPPSPQPQPQPTQDEESRQSKKPEKSFTKEGIPVITADNPDDFHASDVRKTTPGQPAVTKSKKGGKSKKRSPRPGSVVLDHAPTAREAAFGGPPRYDWIDVEVSFLDGVRSCFNAIVAVAFHVGIYMYSRSYMCIIRYLLASKFLWISKSSCL
jgi:hypothetical protein